MPSFTGPNYQAYGFIHPMESQVTTHARNEHFQETSFSLSKFPRHRSPLGRCSHHHRLKGELPTPRGCVGRVRANGVNDHSGESVTPSFVVEIVLFEINHTVDVLFRTG